MFEIGYSTGTYDFIHDGHFRILQIMKSRCKYLMIGLTTDELAGKQKRKPIMSFNHRRTILENCKHVDIVVAHNGESKQDMWQKLKFDVLFIGDDYYDKLEYTSFSSVPTIFIPRTPGISTTRLIESFHSNLSIITNAIHGPIFRLDNEVVKYVNIGKKESNNTRDAYILPIPRPRNWKRKDAIHINENIAGVNTNRELKIHNYILGLPWNPVISIELAWSTMCVNDIGDGSIHNERSHPVEIYIMRQRFAGKTLKEWWCTAEDHAKKYVLEEVQKVILMLQKYRVVHGDIHSGNICISEDLNVSLIDFGWCLHYSFEMTSDERNDYEKKLRDDFDRIHFENSMEWDNLV